ncbi:MAG: 50S ribosomal protein L10 [Clostridia bacterium]|nr:50S ribosomal protein L10 [Clostridia bacterium]
MPNKEILKKKEEEVKIISDKVKGSKAIIVVEYRGVNAEQITNIRADLRKCNAEYKVTKNNIIKRGFEDAGIKELDDSFVGPVAVVYGKEDYLEPAKILYNFSKDNEFYKIKSGIIDGKIVTAEDIITLAKLPSREVLIAQLAGSLLATVGKLAIAVDQVRKQKEEAVQA